MAARVHCPRRLRSIALFALFGNAECIHISAERDGPVAIAALKRSDDTRAANPFSHLVETELFELGRDEGTGALFLEAELRMGVQIAAPNSDFPFESSQIKRDSISLSNEGATRSSGLRSAVVAAMTFAIGANLLPIAAAV